MFYKIQVIPIRLNLNVPVSYTFLCLNFTSFLKMQKYVECSIRSALKCGHFDTKPPV